MIASNRTTIQLSVLAAFATVAFGTLSVSNAESVKPPVVETARTAQTSTNTIEEKKANERLLLRYTQLWNMYRFRNEVTMTEADKDKVDALIAEVQAPKLHADMTPKEIRSKISTNAAELSKRLRVEMARGLAPDAAQANLAYLQGTLIKRLSDPKLYAMSDKKFREEFLSVLPDDPSLPEAITNRTSPNSSLPASSNATVN
ncbi:hypothetical protein BH10BDE1_BH10BDE1_31200 [soil metagenome]